MHENMGVNLHINSGNVDKNLFDHICKYIKHGCEIYICKKKHWHKYGYTHCSKHYCKHGFKHSCNMAQTGV